MGGVAAPHVAKCQARSLSVQTYRQPLPVSQNSQTIAEAYSACFSSYNGRRWYSCDTDDLHSGDDTADDCPRGADRRLRYPDWQCPVCGRPAELVDIALASPQSQRQGGASFAT